MPWPSWIRRNNRAADPAETQDRPGEHHTLADLDRYTIELLRQEWGCAPPDPLRGRRWSR